MQTLTFTGFKKKLKGNQSTWKGNIKVCTERNNNL